MELMKKLQWTFNYIRNQFGSISWSHWCNWDKLNQKVFLQCTCRSNDFHVCTTFFYALCSLFPTYAYRWWWYCGLPTDCSPQKARDLLWGCGICGTGCWHTTQVHFGMVQEMPIVSVSIIPLLIFSFSFLYTHIHMHTYAHTYTHMNNTHIIHMHTRTHIHKQHTHYTRIALRKL